MGPSVVVCGGARGAPAFSSLFHVRADSGEGGGEVFEGPRECGGRVVDREGDGLHSSPVSYDGRSEGGVFFGLFLDFHVAAEVRAKADCHDDEGALFLVERGWVW